MNPVYLINPPLPSPFPLGEPNEDQHLQLFSPSSEASSSSLSNSIFSIPAQEQGGSCDIEQKEAIKFVLVSDHHEFLESPLLPTEENGLNDGLQVLDRERDDRDGYQSNGGSVKWMSSKMILMRKMTKFQDDQRSPTSPLDTDNSSNSSSNKCNNNNNNNNNTVRVCSDCYTTKTPLWRSGPRGPKSVCNACGIRQRKARRAMAAAAASGGGLLGNETSSMRTKLHKEKRSDNKNVQQYKKRCKLTGPRSKKKLCFEDFTINLSKNSAFHQVFPQDEKEAAILLMALSCGLVHG